MPGNDNPELKGTGDTSQQLVEDLVNYEVGAEACLRYLRAADQDMVQQIWSNFHEEFLKDPTTYPSGQPPTDPEGKRLFHLKCASFYFDAAWRPPRPLNE